MPWISDKRFFGGAPIHINTRGATKPLGNQTVEALQRAFHAFEEQVMSSAVANRKTETLATVDGTGVSTAAVYSVITAGDLSQLSQADKIRYYMETCHDLGLNWRTKPFIISKIGQGGGEQLYLTLNGAEQLAELHNVSIVAMQSEKVGNSYRVRTTLKLPNGRTHIATGAVSIAGLAGQTLENALMKAETKAFRRGVRAIVGLNTFSEKTGQEAAFAAYEPQMTAADLAQVTVSQPDDVVDVETQPLTPLQIAKRRLWSMAKTRDMESEIELAALAALMGLELDACSEQEFNELTQHLLDNDDAKELIAQSGYVERIAAERAHKEPEAESQDARDVA